MKTTFTSLLFFTAVYGYSQTLVSTGSLATARSSHESQELSTGNIMVMGGDNYNLSSFSTFKSTEVYNITTGTWSPGISMKDPRSNFSSVKLNSGKILVMGGAQGDYYSGSAFIKRSCELYDPISNTWSYTDSMQIARDGNFAIKLNSGKVLVAGGTLGSTVCELYDPSTGLWTTTGSLANSREGQSITLLNSGNILIAGGYTTSAEIYNVSSGAWSSVGNMTKSHNRSESILLNNNKVLITSGGSVTCELFDPSTNLFSTTGSVNAEKNACPQILLANGNPLSFGLGDFTSFSNTKCLEVYNVATGAWSNTIYNTGMNLGAVGYTIHKLSNGKIIIIGGSYTSGNGSSTNCYLLTEGLTSVNERMENVNFKLYPNPSTQYVTISASEASGKFSLSILDVNGNEVKHLSDITHEASINIENLSGGLYIVKITQGDFSSVTKFVKQ